jgi:hypothetical protein
LQLRATKYVLQHRSDSIYIFLDHSLLAATTTHR